MYNMSLYYMIQCIFYVFTIQRNTISKQKQPGLTTIKCMSGFVAPFFTSQGNVSGHVQTSRGTEQFSQSHEIHNTCSGNQFAKLLPVESKRFPANSACLLLGNLKWKWEVNCITESVKTGISYWRWWFLLLSYIFVSQIGLHLDSSTSTQFINQWGNGISMGSWSIQQKQRKWQTTISHGSPKSLQHLRIAVDVWHNF